MKNLVIVRHAKSDWSHQALRDHDRPLNSRGKIDAPLMANIAKIELPSPDLILSSSANRALATAISFAKVFGIAESKIEVEKKLYHSSEEEMLEVLSWQEGSINTIYLFAHNPGITFFASEINSDQIIDNVPTTGILNMAFSGDHWKNISFRDLDLVSFLYPKMYK